MPLVLLTQQKMPRWAANICVLIPAWVLVRGAATALAGLAAIGRVVVLVTVLAAVLAKDPISKQ